MMTLCDLWRSFWWFGDPLSNFWQSLIAMQYHFGR